MTDHPYHAAAFGATSAICVETLRAIARDKPAKFLLIGRDSTRLDAVAADLRGRGAECITLIADFSDPKTNWQQLLAENSQNTPWDLFLIAHGTLPNQESALNDSQELENALNVNFVSPAIIASACAQVLENQARGTLAVFGSVAGDRGRGSNFVYGSAKAGIDTFLAGMRHHFAKNPEIKIVTLKPGMTDSPMTAHLPKGPLFSSAESVGMLSWKAIKSASSVSYQPGWWRYVMLLIRFIPNFLFHRTKL